MDCEKRTQFDVPPGHTRRLIGWFRDISKMEMIHRRQDYKSSRQWMRLWRQNFGRPSWMMPESVDRQTPYVRAYLWRFVPPTFQNRKVATCIKSLIEKDLKILGFVFGPFCTHSHSHTTTHRQRGSASKKVVWNLAFLGQNMEILHFCSKIAKNDSYVGNQYN